MQVSDINRPIHVNPQANIFVRTWQIFWVKNWDITSRLQAQMVIAYFYIFSAMLFIYLEVTLPPDVNFGLRQINKIWGIPPIFVIAIYAIFGIMMTQPNHKPTTYFLLLTPSLLYSMALAQISLEGNVLVWTAFIYTLSFVGLAVVTLHQRYAIGQINRSVFQDAGAALILEQKVKNLMKERTQKDKAYMALQQFFTNVTDSGNKGLTQDGVILVLSYMSIFVDEQGIVNGNTNTNTNNNIPDNPNGKPYTANAS